MLAILALLIVALGGVPTFTVSANYSESDGPQFPLLLPLPVHVYISPPLAPSAVPADCLSHQYINVDLQNAISITVMDEDVRRYTLPLSN